MTASKKLLFLGLLFLLFAAPAFGKGEMRYRAVIPSSDPDRLLRVLERADFDVAGKDPITGSVEVIVSASELKRLVDMGLDPTIKGSSRPGGERSIPTGYHDFTTIVSMMNDWANNNPTFVDMVDIGMKYGTRNTYEDRPLYALKISDNVTVDENEPNILIVSNHHAREIVTPELALHIIGELVDNYGTDPDTTRWIDNNEIWIAPVWNPDGLVYCWTVYDYWRKNRNYAGSGYYGIDLNRNYPYGWYGPYSGSTWPGSDTYKGPSPASEQETKALMAWARDRHFAKSLDFHSYGREVLYTYYLSSSFPSALETWFRNKAIAFSQELGYAGDYRKPSAEGEHYQWELNELGAFSYLVETHYDFQPSYSSAVAEAQLIYPGVQWFIDHEIPLQGHVTEARTGAPLVADIDIAGITYTEGEIRQSESRFGRFHYFLPPGTYNVTFSATGYTPRTVQVTVNADESTVLETQLGTDPVLTVTGRVAPGETLDLSFDWPAGAGENFINGVSLINTGHTFNNGVFYPIGVDTILKNTAGNLPGWSGVLDGSGHASAVLDIPNDPGLAGTLFYMAWFAYVSQPLQPSESSAAVTLIIEP